MPIGCNKQTVTNNCLWQKLMQDLEGRVHSRDLQVSNTDPLQTSIHALACTFIWSIRYMLLRASIMLCISWLGMNPVTVCTQLCILVRSYCLSLPSCIFDYQLDMSGQSAVSIMHVNLPDCRIGCV